MVSESLRKKMALYPKLCVKISTLLAQGRPNEEIVGSMSGEFRGVWDEKTLAGIVGKVKSESGIKILKGPSTKGAHHKDAELAELTSYFDEVARKSTPQERILDVGEAMRRVNMLRGKVGPVSSGWVAEQLKKLNTAAKVQYEIVLPEKRRNERGSYAEMSRKLSEKLGAEGNPFARANRDHFKRKPLP